MEKILRILGKEYSSVTQAALVIGIFSLLSQILGLFRDRFYAHFIGPGPDLDAYFAAFQVPDLIFNSVASLATVTVLVPFILARMPEGYVTDSARKFMNDVFTVFFSSLVLVSFIIFLLMPKIAPIVAPGLSIEAQKEVIELSRIMLLSPILLGLSNLFGAITQLFRKFFIFAISPIFYNLGIIVGIYFFYPSLGITGVAWGVILGALLHCLVQVFASSGSGFTPAFSRNIDFSAVKSVVRTSLPRTLGISLNSLSLIVLVALGSALYTGSISIFRLATNLETIPLMLIGYSYAIAAFPAMTKSFTTGNNKEFIQHLRMTARSIIFWSLPISVLFIVLRAQIVRVILGSPSFSWENTRLVAASLAVFSISIMAQSLISLFARAYYATGNTRRPLYINLISSLSIMSFAFLFLQMFKFFSGFRFFFESMLRVDDLHGTEVLMLPLAYSLGTILNFILFWFYIKKDFLKDELFIKKTFFQILTASFAIGIVSYFFLNIFSPIFGTITFWGVFWQGFISGVLGIIAGVFVLVIFKNEELKEFWNGLRSKFWRAKVITDTQEGL